MGIVKNPGDAGELEVKSLVSGRTFEPLVEIIWGGKRAQLGIEEAQQLALHVLECAEAAESDAFVFQWLTRDIVGTPEDEKDNWNRIIGEFKAYREARLSKEGR